MVKITTISTCYKRKDYYFCNYKNRSIKTLQKSRPHKTYGYCCPNAPKKVAKQCKPTINNQCTSTLKKPSLPVYMSYWPGQKSCAKNRPSRKIIASGRNYKVIIDRSLLKARKAKLYESCFWTISTKNDI